ncbi:peptidase [Desulfosporosinus fructosivorans]|uniref:Peptidase n=1 Tax=Desulfosporosinus fructosivorans TaxID=2018669 RepID=A0A4Z0R9P4_9FIRM|nr:S8 family serine peptidase [Desulfosporosinus fructosivorans]TGE39570.1 peptidase [Desulfosporosinus fructosivorans]
MFIRRKIVIKAKYGLVTLLIMGLTVCNLGLAPLPAKPFQVIISLAPGVNVDAVAQDFGVEVVRRGPLNYATLEFKGNTGTTTNVQQVLETLKKTPGIIDAEENYRRTINASGLPVPKDPLFEEQWSMVSGNVQGAWGLGATGQGITIAVIDTGVALGHPDLQDNLVSGYNAITESEAPGANRDNNGHGTHVAGIAAAARNDVGIVGVAYQAKIMPIKAMDSVGEGYDDAIAAGIVWAADHGAKIINLSVGTEHGSHSSDILRNSIAYAYNQGCLLVAAVGNYDPLEEENPGVSYPASDPDVLAVAATDQDNIVASYSVTGSEVDLVAPGNSITSTWWSKSTGAGYAIVSGTSMAAPFVSGEAALIWSQHPAWSRDQVIQVMEAGVEDLGASGRDPLYGYGLVDVKLALTLANQIQEDQTASTSVGALGGTVQASAGSTQLTLTIPAQAFVSSADVAVKTIPAPANLPNGASFLTSVFQMDWGSVTPQKMLSFKVNDPSLKADLGGVVYRWTGSRWLASGGEIVSGEARLGLYKGGIYAVGTPQESIGDKRMAGVTAEETAVKISQATYTTGADTVILAQVNQFQDALAGAPLAYKLQAPILLSPNSGLTEGVRAELQRLAPKTIYLLGGTAALSSGIEAELRQTYDVKRLAGYSAEGTSVAIARELGTKGKAVVASVRSFQDALVISAWAARQGIPILLTELSSLSRESQNVLEELKVTETLVIGGTSVVGANIAKNLPNSKRISGNTAYDTAAAVLQAYPPTTVKLELATGENYPDALTGAVRAAYYGSMVVLVPTHSAIPRSLSTLLNSWKGRQVEAFGGVMALPENVVQTVESWVQ